MQMTTIEEFLAGEPAPWRPDGMRGRALWARAYQNNPEWARRQWNALCERAVEATLECHQARQELIERHKLWGLDGKPG
jgi:FPC/CPF motif-containing protein YcgG